MKLRLCPITDASDGQGKRTGLQVVFSLKPGDCPELDAMADEDLYASIGTDDFRFRKVMVMVALAADVPAEPCTPAHGHEAFRHCPVKGCTCNVRLLPGQVYSPVPTDIIPEPPQGGSGTAKPAPPENIVFRGDQEPPRRDR